MAAPPFILAALLLFLAWRTRGRAWRAGMAGLGFACLVLGAVVALTDPRAFETNSRLGWFHSFPRWR